MSDEKHAIYVRKSPYADLHRGADPSEVESTRNQADLLIAAATHWINQHGGTLMRGPDNGAFGEIESATAMNWDERPVLQMLMKALDARDHLWIWRFDRAVRGGLLTVVGFVAECCQVRRIQLHEMELFGGQPLDVNSLDGEARIMAVGIAGRIDKQLRSAGAKSTHARRKAEGIYVNRMPPPGRRIVCLPERFKKRGNPKTALEWSEQYCAICFDLYYRTFHLHESIVQIRRDYYNWGVYYPWRFCFGDAALKCPKCRDGGHKLTRLASDHRSLDVDSKAIEELMLWYRRWLESGRDLMGQPAGTYCLREKYDTKVVCTKFPWPQYRPGPNYRWTPEPGAVLSDAVLALGGLTREDYPSLLTASL